MSVEIRYAQPQKPTQGDIPSVPGPGGAQSSIGQASHRTGWEEKCLMSADADSFQSGFF